MKTSVETLDPVKVKLTVEVEPKRVKQAFDRAARELAKQVNVPGFRPGKAPRRLIEQRFGEGVIAQQALEDSLTDLYIEAIRAEELVPVGQPEVDVESFTEAEGATFTATVEIRPELDLPDHTGISVNFPSWDVDDSKIDEQLEQMRERFAEVEVVERAAKEGDLVDHRPRRRDRRGGARVRPGRGRPLRGRLVRCHPEARRGDRRRLGR